MLIARAWIIAGLLLLSGCADDFDLTVTTPSNVEAARICVAHGFVYFQRQSATLVRCRNDAGDDGIVNALRFQAAGREDRNELTGAAGGGGAQKQGLQAN